MPTLKPNMSYELTKTYTTDEGENRICLIMNYTDSQEFDGSFVNTIFEIAKIEIGYGQSNVSTANVEHLLYESLPQYFTE